MIDGEGDTQGWNRYSYVKGNPIVYKDPTGHTAEGEKYENSSEVWKEVYDKVQSTEGLNKSQKSKMFDNMIRKRLEIPQVGIGQKNCIATSKTMAMMAEGLIKNKADGISRNNYMNLMEKTLYDGKKGTNRLQLDGKFDRAAANFNHFKNSNLKRYSSLSAKQREEYKKNYESDNIKLINKAKNSDELGKKKKGEYYFKNINSREAFKALNDGKVLAGYGSGSGHANSYYLNPFSQKIKRIDPWSPGKTSTASRNNFASFRSNTSGTFEKIEKVK